MDTCDGVWLSQGRQWTKTGGFCHKQNVYIEVPITMSGQHRAKVVFIGKNWSVDITWEARLILLLGHTKERDSCTCFTYFLKCSSFCSLLLIAPAAFMSDSNADMSKVQAGKGEMPIDNKNNCSIHHS